MNNINILDILNNIDNYNRFKPYVQPHLLGKEAAIIYKDIAAWYEEDSARTDIDWAEFASWFKFARHPMFKPERMEIFDKIFATLAEHESTSTTEAILQALIERDAAFKIAEKALAVSDGDVDTDIAEIGVLWDKYLQESDSTSKMEDWIIDKTPLELVSEVFSDEGYHYPWKELNDNLRPLRAGNLIVVAARSNVGKTTFAAHIAAHVGKQMTGDKKILWFNNDQSGPDAKIRIIQSALGWTEGELRSKSHLINEQYATSMRGMLDRITFVDRSSLSIYDVEMMLKKHGGTDFVVFDQLWKIHGFEKEAGNEATRQTMLCAWARDICKRFPVLALHQADGTAEGMKWISQGQLHLSKVGVPGEADIILTIGKEPDGGNMRGLHIAKCKTSCTQDKFEMELLPEIARYRGFL